MRSRPFARPLAAVAGLSLAASVALGAGAQAVPATPVGSPGIAAEPPGAEECRVEPRDAAAIARLAGTPRAELAATPDPVGSPAPFEPPAGEPADPATVEAVTATVRELTACGNAGETARVYALYTDAGLLRFLAQEGTSAEGTADQIATPDAIELPTGASPVPALEAVRLLPDGRVGAVLVIGTERVESRSYVVFRLVGDRYLVDDLVPDIETGPGTPAA